VTAEFDVEKAGGIVETEAANRACKLFNIHLYATLCFNYFR